jgi:hypothetical protein
MHESLKGFYRLFRRCRRPIAGDGAAAAASAVLRRETSDYDPQTLADYLAAGGRRTRVRGG